MVGKSGFMTESFDQTKNIDIFQLTLIWIHPNGKMMNFMVIFEYNALVKGLLNERSPGLRWEIRWYWFIDEFIHNLFHKIHIFFVPVVNWYTLHNTFIRLHLVQTHVPFFSLEHETYGALSPTALIFPDLPICKQRKARCERWNANGEWQPVTSSLID